MNDVAAMIPTEAVKIEKVKDHIGAIATGIDLAQPIDAATQKKLYDSVVENVVLVIRGQEHLTPGQLQAAGELFGELMEDQNRRYLVDGFPLISVLDNRHLDSKGQPAKLGANATWHTDHTNRERPPAATILYGVEIPSAGGGTSVANMRAAYVALPEDERRRLDSLKTYNSLDSGKTDTRQEDREKYGKTIEHPMVRTHPVHGSRAVYFHISKATHIEGMAPEASRAYMAELIERMIRPEIVYHHVWRKGDVLVIDDRATMHRAHGDYDRSQSRVLWRIIVEGDRPVLI